MSGTRADIVVRCDHGITDGPAEYVARYRWMAGQATWVPVDASGVTLSLLDSDWTTGGSKAGREHHDIRCQRCPRKMSVRGEALSWALRLIANSGNVDVTIKGLQGVLANMPRALKGER